MGSSTQVVPTTSNTQQSTQIPQYLQDAGMAATSDAEQYASTPFQPFSGETVAPLTGNQSSAITTAANSGDVGQPQLQAAQSYLNSAGGNLAQGATDLSTGRGAINAATTVANDSVGAGLGSANLGATLASLAGTSAAGSTSAGAPDLAQAATYNADAAAPISGSTIASYFNPYVQQSLDPVIANLTRSAGQTQAGLDSKAGMQGAFGGSRLGLEESQNTKNLQAQIATTTGAGYDTAYNDALAAAQAQQATYGKAATTSLGIGSQADTSANDAVSRLTSAAGANETAGTTESNLADATQNRFLNLVAPSVSVTGADQNLATGNQSLAGAEGTLAGQSSQLTTDQINRLLTTGALEQTQQQNVDNAAYQTYQNQQDYALKQLNALIAAAGGTPYGTTSTSNTQGTQVVQTPSVLGQVAGALGTVAGAAIGSNRDWKEDFGDVDDEDVLSKFRNLTVETYKYKPEVREAIGDDGRERIGPMAQQWAQEFGGNGKVIPMPEIMGAMVSAVRALERRTASGALAA